VQFAERYLAIYDSAPHRPQLTAGTPSLDDILREHLKLAYNLMLQYSRAPPIVPEGFGKPSASASASGASLGTGKKRFWRSREKSGASNSSSPELGAADDASDAGSAAAASAQGGKSPRSLAQKVVDAVKGSSASAASSPAGSPSLGASKELGSQPASASGAAPAQAPAAAMTEGGSSDSLSLTATQLFLPLFRPYLTLAVTLPPLSTTAPSAPASSSASTTSAPPIKDPSPVVRAALNTLLNFPVELEELSGWSTSWLQYVPPRISPDDGTVLRGGGIGSLGERLVELLHGVCEAYFPADRAPPSPKAYSARDRDEGRTLVPPCGPDEWIPTGEGEAAKVDEILGPVMLLLRKLSMLGEAQFVFRNVLFPPNLCVESFLPP